MSAFEDPRVLVEMLPVFALPLVVLLASFLEYVFPPFWGDVLLLVSFFLAGSGGEAAAPVWQIFAAGLAGSMLGSLGAYLMGRRFGFSILGLLTRKKSPAEIQVRLRGTFERFGEPILLANRFLPVVRGVMLYGAGVLHLRFGRTMLFSAVSSAFYLGLLMWVGLFTADSWDRVVETFRTSSAVVTAVAIAAVVLWVGLRWWLRRSGDES